MQAPKSINETLSEGARAFLDGQSIESNPYSIHTENGQRWRRGYANASYFKGLEEKINNDKD